MAMLDRLKDAARTTNSIEAVQPLAGPQRPADLHGANPGAPPNVPPAPRKAASDPSAPAYTTEPEVISRAYYVENKGGERRYFADYQRKDLAIRADDARISSKKEDLVTIRAMLTLAESKGWSEVKVGGTADFRRETWIEAQARGITAQGHKASDLDRQEADRRRAERGQAPGQAAPKQDVNEVRPVASQAGQAAATAKAVQNVPPAAAQQRDAEPSRPATDLHGANRGPRQDVPQQAAAPGYSLSARNLDVVASASLSIKAAPDQQPARPAAVQQPAPAPQQQLAPANVDHRRALRDATAELSPDGRLVLAALSEKIDRQMNKLNANAKLETKAFAAAELVKKEKLEGPVVLSPELRKLAIAPEPAQVRQAPAPASQPSVVQQVEPQPPQRSRGR